MLLNDVAPPVGLAVSSASVFGQEFHLLCAAPVSHVRVFRPDTQTLERPAILVLPPRVAFVRAPADELPSLLDVPPESFQDILIFETFLDVQQRPRLAVVNPGGASLRVNDYLSPRLVVLTEGDLVSLDGLNPMHVAIYNRPYVGKAPPEIVGSECRVCRLAFTGESKCYACSCGASLHCEDDHSLEGALQCALSVPECPSCQRSIILTEGYLSTPDFMHA